MKETSKLVDTEDNFPYTDILNNKYQQSLKYPHLSKLSRASQFSPFAALTGYDEEVKEVERYVLPTIELTEDYREILDRNLSNILPNDKVKVRYFVKDKTKNGGKFLSDIKYIKKIDSLEGYIVFTDNTHIYLKDIVNIDKINSQDIDNLL